MVAGLAGEASRVLSRSHLWEVLGLGGAGSMAAYTQHGSVKFERLNGCGIGGMLGQRAVASFAMDTGVHSGLLLCCDVRVAGFACGLSGEVNWPGSDLGDGRSAIVSVLSEALRNDEVASDQEQDKHHRKEKGESEKMFRIPEALHETISLSHDNCSEPAPRSVNPKRAIRCCLIERQEKGKGM